MDNIKTPEELLTYMSNNIIYGYLGSDNKIYYFDDPHFDENWFQYDVLQSPEEVLENKCGNCLDQVELERDWFTKHNYQFDTFYTMVMVDYKNDYQIHAFLVYKDEDNRWCLFENADFDNRGIYKFDTLEEALKYQRSIYINGLKTVNIKDDEIDKIITTKFSKPSYHISMSSYIDYVTSFDDIKL